MHVGQLVVGSIPTAETGVEASHGCDPVVDHAELFVMAYSEGVLLVSGIPTSEDHQETKDLSDSLHITVRERGKKQDQSRACPTIHPHSQTYWSALRNHDSDDAVYSHIHKPSAQQHDQRLVRDRMTAGQAYHNDDVLVQAL
jgi:hypothetical protein